MKTPALKFLTPAIAGLCLGLVPNAVKAATTDYFTTSVSPGGTYSWDGPNWDTGSGSYTSYYFQGGFPEFKSATSYTVTVNATESMAGMYQDGGSSSTLTIDDAGNGTGSLSITSGVQGFLMYGATIINADITGTGGIDPEYEGSSAALSLFGDNSYSGGTALTSSSTLVYFSNNNSFGTGTIAASYSSGSYAPLLSTGGSTITLANNIQNTGTGGGINFANGASTPVVLTGTVSLGTTTFSIRNNGNSTAPLTINGVIGGSTGGNLVLSGANGGTIHLGAVNAYTGTTTIGVSGDAKVTLELDAANAISSSSQIILAGGTLSPGGFNHTMAGTLDLTASSTIDYTLGGSLSFADSSGVAWGSGDVLDLANWTAGDDLYFGGTGLTAAQLDEIEFDGNSSTLGSAQLDNGYIVEATPEPSTIALGLIGGLGVFLMRRKKA